MPCYHPLVAWKVEGKVLFHLPSGLGRDNKAVPYPKLNLPCGKCIGCRLNYARSWALRCELESFSHKDNCFITLTFSPEQLEKRDNPWSVDKRDFQLFMKRVRKKYGDHIRYFHCGEYGEKNGRPHYHALLFGIDFRNKILTSITKKFKKKILISTTYKDIDNKVEKYGKKYPIYNSTELQKLWPYGHTTVGELNFTTASYTARYVTKKVKTPYEHSRIINTPDGVRKVEDVYCTMSRGNNKSKQNGIGEQHYNLRKHQIYGNDFITNKKGVRMKPPRYFDKLYERDHPDLFAKVKKNRISKLELIDEHDPHRQRLLDIEEVKLLKLKEQLRELDS